MPLLNRSGKLAQTPTTFHPKDAAHLFSRGFINDVSDFADSRWVKASRSLLPWDDPYAALLLEQDGEDVVFPALVHCKETLLYMGLDSIFADECWASWVRMREPQRMTTIHSKSPALIEHIRTAIQNRFLRESGRPVPPEELWEPRNDSLSPTTEAYDTGSSNFQQQQPQHVGNFGQDPFTEVPQGSTCFDASPTRDLFHTLTADEWADIMQAIAKENALDGSFDNRTTTITTPPIKDETTLPGPDPAFHRSSPTTHSADQKAWHAAYEAQMRRLLGLSREAAWFVHHAQHNPYVQQTMRLFGGAVFIPPPPLDTFALELMLLVPRYRLLLKMKRMSEYRANMWKQPPPPLDAQLDDILRCVDPLQKAEDDPAAIQQRRVKDAADLLLWQRCVDSGAPGSDHSADDVPVIWQIPDAWVCASVEYFIVKTQYRNVLKPWQKAPGHVEKLQSPHEYLKAKSWEGIPLGDFCDVAHNSGV